MSPPIDSERFFWRHAFADDVLYVHASDVTAYLRQWAEKTVALSGAVSGDDLRRTADELDAEWIGFATEKQT